MDRYSVVQAVWKLLLLLSVQEHLAPLNELCITLGYDIGVHHGLCSLYVQFFSQ